MTHYYKLRHIIKKYNSYVITKCDKSLMQSATGFSLANATVMTKCNDFITNAVYITKCVGTDIFDVKRLKEKFAEKVIYSAVLY